MDVIDGLDSGLKHFLHAAETGLSGGVDRAAFELDAEARGGEERVLLGVNADADVVGGAGGVALVAIEAAETAAVGAVLHARWSAVVAGGDDVFIEDNDGANFLSAAIGALADGHGDAEEVGMKIRTIGHEGQFSAEVDSAQYQSGTAPME